jgi:hypothetical protein
MIHWERKFELVVPEWGNDKDAGSFNTKIEAVIAALSLEVAPGSVQIYRSTYIYLPFGFLILRTVRLTDWTVA